MCPLYSSLQVATFCWVWLTEWWSGGSSSQDLVEDIISVAGAGHAVPHLHHGQLRAQAGLTVHLLHRLRHNNRHRHHHHHRLHHKHSCHTAWCWCVSASAGPTLSLSVGSFREYSLLVMSLPMRYLNTSLRKVSDSRKKVSLSRDQHRNLQFSSAMMVTWQSTITTFVLQEIRFVWNRPIHQWVRVTMTRQVRPDKIFDLFDLEYNLLIREVMKHWWHKWGFFLFFFFYCMFIFVLPGTSLLCATQWTWTLESRWMNWCRYCGGSGLGMIPSSCQRGTPGQNFWNDWLFQLL